MNETVEPEHIRLGIERQPRAHFGAIIADPPWAFKAYSEKGDGRSAVQHYGVMDTKEIAELPVRDVAAKDCVLGLWTTWPHLKSALWVMQAWGFTYKTCMFDWMKANTSQIDLFRDDAEVQIGGGYWTRSNTEPCLLGTRGHPKRLDKGVRMGIVEPRREHSRKPGCVHSRVERLVAGPYLELFGRRQIVNWTVLGNEANKFRASA